MTARRLMMAGVAALIGLAPASASAGETAIPRFAAEARAAGIDSVYAGDWEFTVGGGAAVLDCDDDGFPDLFLAGGENPARFYRNASRRGGPLAFTRADSGLELTGATGAYPLDIDSDGRMDLVVLRVGENVAMRGMGHCRFERANEAWGFAGGDGWSTAMAATWEKGSQWPTLAIGNYVDRTEDISPWGSCTDNWLHRPVAGERRFATPLALKPSHCALSMLFTDWNDSGTVSLRVSNDREYYEGGQEQMWHVEPGAAPRLYTQDEGWKFLRIWGMGIAARDLDGDRRPEYFLTSMADNKLQTLAAPAPGAVKPDYKDVAFARGVTAHRPHAGTDLRPSTAWHAQFEDVNNDGLADLMIVKGNVAKMPDFAEKDPNNLLLQLPDGRFREAAVEAGVASTAVGRGGAMADFNLDGLIDLVVVNRWEPAELWRNTSATAGRWLQLRLSQQGANRDAVGAKLTVTAGGRTMLREVSVGGGHVSGSAGWLHFGLGEAAEAELVVDWPDGSRSKPMRLAADGFYILAHGSDDATPWQPR